MLFVLNITILCRFQSIYRFSAHNALGCLSPFHPIRRLAIYVLTHWMFTFCIILTILYNSFVMTREESAFNSAIEVVFTAIYRSVLPRRFDTT